MTMTLQKKQKKAFLQTATSSATSKGKKIATGGTVSADHHSRNSNIVLQPVQEEHSSLAGTSERAANEHQSRLPAEG